jgi:hypothetical protein
MLVDGEGSKLAFKPAELEAGWKNSVSLGCFINNSIWI